MTISPFQISLPVTSKPLFYLSHRALFSILETYSAISSVNINLNFNLHIPTKYGFINHSDGHFSNQLMSRSETADVNASLELTSNHCFDFTLVLPYWITTLYLATIALPTNSTRRNSIWL